MNAGPRPTGEALAQRVRDAGEQLRSALMPLTNAAAGQNAGPGALSVALGLDMATSSRVMRALRLTDSAALVHGLPSPRGLSLVVQAARVKGVEAAICDEAEAAIEQLSSLIRLFPGGRKAMMAAISGWVPSIRQRDEQEIKQASFQSYAHLLGIEIDAIVKAHVIMPGVHETYADFAFMQYFVNIRRLRSSHPIAIFSSALVTKESSSSDYLTLEGNPIRSAEDLLVDDFCTHPTSALSLLNDADRKLWVVLGGDTPPVNAKMSLATANLAKGAMVCRAIDKTVGTTSTVVHRFPSKVLIWDTYIHKDLFPGVSPIITPRYYGMQVPWKDPANEYYRVDQVDLTVPVQPLGPGLVRSEIADAPEYVELMHQAFRRLGQPEEAFSCHRCEVQYPVPFVSLERLLALPGR